MTVIHGYNSKRNLNWAPTVRYLCGPQDRFVEDPHAVSAQTVKKITCPDCLEIVIPRLKAALEKAEENLHHAHAHKLGFRIPDDEGQLQPAELTQ